MNEPVVAPSRTEHALLVLWGEYAQHLGLIEALEAVPLHQKVRTHRPQSKVLEFLVAILAGLPHLEDLSRDAHPLDQDAALARAWRQPGWADYSGVSRTLQALTLAEAQGIGQVLDEISQPFIDQEVMQAVRQQGRLVYDGDLTGRPVSNSSTTYPDAAYGYMDDAVHLGYQAAVVSLRSPTYGRLWLSVQPHPGNTVPCTQAEALVLATEGRTGVRPLRRTDLLRQRLQGVSRRRTATEQRLAQRQAALAQAQTQCQARSEQRQSEQAALANLEADYRAHGRPERPHSRLAQARTQVDTRQRQCQRQVQVVAQTQRQVERQQQRLAQCQALEATLRQRLQCCEQENATNLAPIQAVFRLDAGFGTWENIAWLIEMGYEVYTKPHSHQLTASVGRQVNGQTPWTRVGDNAEMVAWPSMPLRGCPYPLDVGLERFYTGQTVRHGVLLHFGQAPVTTDLPAWFAEYNGRQTIEAGIKEGKGIFQMHHLKVRATPALWLQEQFAAFAANFVRWAAHWLDSQCLQMPAQWAAALISSVKTSVQVAAHSPAYVEWWPDGCVLRFADESRYAGRAIQTGGWAFQLSLPLFKSCVLDPLLMTEALIAQSLRIRRVNR